MKKRILLAMYIGFFSVSYAQTEKGMNQVGLSGVPLFDVLGLYPDNEIAGGAFMANYGTFINDHMSFGVQPYYARAANEYPVEGPSLYRQRQAIRVIGLSAYLRYYYLATPKWWLFGSTSLGFGNYHEETTDLATLRRVNEGNENESVSLLTVGVGVDYWVTSRLALELNTSYAFVYEFSTDPYSEDFHTIIPTLGVQYYW